MNDNELNERFVSGEGLDQGFTPAAIRKHLDRQKGVKEGFVKLDTGKIVPIGERDDGD